MIDVKKEIQRIRDLETEYRKCCKSTKLGEKTTDAFLEWYNAVVVILSEFYPSDNSDFIWIRNQDVTGNGYDLYKVYLAINSKCYLMLGKIESGADQVEEITVVELNDTLNDVKRPLVFISHASVDNKIIREFIDNILKNGLGLQDKNIVCTSFPWTTAKPGNNIPQYIKENIEKASVVLAMVSRAYQKSEVCQNEVGASWALNKEPISIVLPNSDYKELGWLFNLDKAIKIADRDSLNLLQEALCELLGLTAKNSLYWDPCVTKFLDSIKDIKSENSKIEDQEKEIAEPKQEALNHDRECFKAFDSEFSENSINYCLYGLQTTTHFSDYDLSIWLNLMQWLEKTSNAFIDSEVQGKAEQLLKSFRELSTFVSGYYSPDRISWSNEDDKDVTLEKWREIHEAKIYSWESDTYDNNQKEREEIVLTGLTKLVPKVEDAYKAFRLSVKNKLFI